MPQSNQGGKYPTHTYIVHTVNQDIRRLGQFCTSLFPCLFSPQSQFPIHFVSFPTSFLTPFQKGAQSFDEDISYMLQFSGLAIGEITFKGLELCSESQITYFNGLFWGFLDVLLSCIQVNTFLFAVAQAPAQTVEL